MKNNCNGIKWMLLASTGALLIYTGPLAQADESVSGRQAEQQQQSQNLETQDADVSGALEFRGEEINEPAGAEKRAATGSFGTLNKTSDLIGMEVRSSQDENLGNIKDVMIDVKTGRIPFVVLAPDGFLRGRLVALPPSALSLGSEDDTLVLNIDKQRMNSAPSFERAQWPEMSNQQFSTEVYRFYNAQPYWRSSSFEGEAIQEQSGASVIDDSAGAEGTTTYRSYESSSGTTHDSSDAEADRVLHLYQAGKQAGIVTDRRLKERGPQHVITPTPPVYKGRISKHAEIHMNEPAQREIVGGYSSPQRITSESTTYRNVPSHATRYQSGTTAYGTSAAVTPVTRFYRASELMGMNIKDSSGQTVGEIKDVAIDLHSGQIAYAMLSAGGFLGVGDEWVAVPPTLLVSGQDAHTLVLNADRAKLQNAPTFDRTNWESVSNQEFVSRVYTHYGQRPYWRASTSLREPSGTELLEDKQYQEQFNQNEQQESIEQGELKDESESKASSEADEAAGTEKSATEADQSYESKDQSGLKEDATVDEPAGAEKSSSEAQEDKDAEHLKQTDDQSGVSDDSELNEPAGAEASSSESESKAGYESKDQSEAKDDTTIDEPAGAEKPSSELNDDPDAEPQDQSKDQSEFKDNEPAGAATPSTDPQDSYESKDQSGLDQSSELNEPSGAATEDEQTAPEKSSSLEDPAGAEPQASPADPSSESSQQDSEAQSPEASSQSSESSSVPSAGFQVPSSAQSSESESGVTQSSSTTESTSISEPSGAETQSSQTEGAYTESAQSKSESGVEAEAAGAPREELSVEQIRAKLQGDSSISGARNVQVSSENGKIVLKGTVNSETDKERIEQKIRELVVDNQIQVQGGAATEQESSDDEETSPEEEQD